MECGICCGRYSAWRMSKCAQCVGAPNVCDTCQFRSCIKIVPSDTYCMQCNVHSMRAVRHSRVGVNTVLAVIRHYHLMKTNNALLNICDALIIAPYRILEHFGSAIISSWSNYFPSWAYISTPIIISWCDRFTILMMMVQAKILINIVVPFCISAVRFYLWSTDW